MTFGLLLLAAVLFFWLMNANRPQGLGTRHEAPHSFTPLPVHATESSKTTTGSAGAAGIDAGAAEGVVGAAEGVAGAAEGVVGAAGVAGAVAEVVANSSAAPLTR